MNEKKSPNKICPDFSIRNNQSKNSHYRIVVLRGFEPQFSGPKPDVLPLYYRTKCLLKIVMYRLYKYSQRICQGQESSQGLRLRQKEEYSFYLNKYIYLNKNIF